jgi:hypothetical protein
LLAKAAEAVIFGLAHPVSGVSQFNINPALPE